MPSAREKETEDISEKLLSMSKRRGFFWPSFEIYGGVAGLYDYGPLGVALRDGIADVWRWMLRSEGFFEIDTPTVNPEEVFRSSGHLDFFSDFLVDCNSCHESFRADHLVDMKGEAVTPDSLSGRLAEEKTKCPRCGAHDFGEPRPFNLMFKTLIGPSGGKTGYLRPETAQGIFMNYQQLSRFYRDRLPFGVMHTGRGYRNEISPRQGLLRLRELNMLEAELFVDPDEKHWEGFKRIRDEELVLLPRKGGQRKMPISRAVSEGIIGSEVLAYFLHLTQRLMLTVGVDPHKLRFRQHALDEMAHYSSDTWDFEALLSSGWTELAGIADRGSYDLSAHIRGSGADLTFFRKSDREQVVRRTVVRAKRSALGPVFKGDAKEIASMLENMDPADVKDRATIDLRIKGRDFSIGREFYSIEEIEERIQGEKIIPHVIEPSMGLDRIFYTVLEHSYTEKDGYTVLRLPGRVSPIKAGVFPLLGDREMEKMAAELHRKLLAARILSYYDDSSSIGRRYARMDEVGTPYCITVDDVTIRDGTVTVRERDSRRQIRVDGASVLETVRRLLAGARLEDFGAPLETVEEGSEKE